MSHFTLTRWLIAAALLVPCAAGAAGLGRLSVLSALGQPFNAEVELVSVQQGDVSSLSVRLASPDAYKQANLQYGAALVGLRMSIEKRADGQPYVKITSSRSVNEPFLDLLIELNWSSGRLMREFTALLDPPGLTPEPVAVAPAPPPVRPAPAAAPPRPAAPPVTITAGSYGPIQKGETLSKIAGTLKPEGVTLEQMLVGLFRSNPDAFINKNMNLVRTGKILQVPDREQLAAVTPAEAVKEYRAQVADWKAYRARLAEAPAPAREGSPAVSGRITTRIDDKAPAEARDVVRLSKGEAPGPGAVGSGGKGTAADRIRALEEEVAARDKALKEANERVTQLEKTIKDMQRLAEIKSEGMAAAQQQAQAKAEAKPEPAKPDAKAPAPEAAGAKPEVSPKPDAAPVTKPEEKAPPKPPADKPKPKSEAKAPPPPPPPSLIDTVLEDPLYLGGGAVVLLGGLGYWLMRRRRREESDSAAVAPAAALAPEPVTPEPTLAPTPPGDDAADTAAPAPAPAAELDPLDEAQVYITHGRDAQAELILTEAIARNPDREALHVKLLEVYALRKDKAAYAKRAEEFHKLVGRENPAWAGIAAMGYALDPDNPLYADGKAAPPAAPPATATAEADLDFNLDVPGTESAPSAPAAPAPASAETGPLDFEIEVPKADAAPSPAPAPARAASAPAEAPPLDFKLDLAALDLSLDDKKTGAAPAGERDAHWHDVQAKFDLAKAYEEMGDKAGAREILKEVMQEGDAEQQTKAKTLLDALG